jgi:hypothetical protein
MNGRADDERFVPVLQMGRYRAGLGSRPSACRPCYESSGRRVEGESMARLVRRHRLEGRCTGVASAHFQAEKSREVGRLLAALSSTARSQSARTCDPRRDLSRALRAHLSRAVPLSRA